MGGSRDNRKGGLETTLYNNARQAANARYGRYGSQTHLLSLGLCMLYLAPFSVLGRHSLAVLVILIHFSDFSLKVIVTVR